MKEKRFRFIWLCSLFFSLVFVSCKEKTFELSMSEINPVDSIVGQMDQRFCDEVYRFSNGTITITLHAGSALGDEKSVLDDMISNKNSAIDFARISPLSLVAYGCKKNELFAIPYTFKDRNHFWFFATSLLIKDFLSEPMDLNLGIRGLFYAEEGFRHFFSTSKIEGIDDLKGKNIRVANDPVMRGFVEDLGGVFQNFALDEIFVKMKTCEVDLAEQPVVNYEANDFYAVAPYLILDGHTIGAIEVICSEKVWNAFSKEQKKAVEKAAEYASFYCRDISTSMEAEALEKLGASGVDILAVKDTEIWRQACKNTITEYTKSDLELYEKILEFGN